jgi:ABC-type transport system substrate-binding protein
MTPYYGGEYREDSNPPNNFNILRTSPSTPGGRWWQTLYRLHYGPGQQTAGWPVQPMDFEDTDGPVRIEPQAAAEMPTKAPDFSYYDVKLKQDLFFHQNPNAEASPEIKAVIEKIGGRNVTAEDVKYVYDTFQDTTKSLFWDNLEYLDRTEVLDKYTLRFHMKRPVMFFDQVMASSFYYIFPREHYELGTQLFGSWAIGTGPFMMQYYKFQDRHEGVRNPKFTEIDRGGFRQPYVDKVIGQHMPDANVEKAAFRSGQQDYMGLNSWTDLEDLLSTNPEGVVWVIPQDPNVHTMYAINWNNPVWGKSDNGLKMRRALSLSIDRQQITEVARGGAGVPSYATPYDFQGLKAPAHWDELGPYYKRDVAEAKRLMADAGYPNGYDVEMLVETGQGSDAINVILQQQMAEAGFRLTFKEVEATVRTNARNDKNYKDLTSGSQDSGYDMEMNIYRLWAGPDAPRNYGAVDDPTLADLAVKQRYELDYNRRLEYARQVHQRYLEIIPILHVVSSHRMTIRHPWIHNWGDNIHSWLCCWGSQQVRQMFLDDKTPDGRGGTRGKENTWGNPYDRQGRKV